MKTARFPYTIWITVPIWLIDRFSEDFPDANYDPQPDHFELPLDQIPRFSGWLDNAIPSVSRKLNVHMSIEISPIKPAQHFAPEIFQSARTKHSNTDVNGGTLILPFPVINPQPVRRYPLWNEPLSADARSSLETIERIVEIDKIRRLTKDLVQLMDPTWLAEVRLAKECLLELSHYRSRFNQNGVRWDALEKLADCNIFNPLSDHPALISDEEWLNIETIGTAFLA